MLITGTSDKIRFVLAASATTQLPFTANYNNYTATSVTQVSVNGTSNNTTAVDIVASPSSSQQNELRYCSIFNADSANATVKIQAFDGTNARVVFQCILLPGDFLQYQLEKGWEVVDSNGNKKTIAILPFNNSMKANSYFRPISATGTVQLTSQQWYSVILGRAEKSYTTFNIVFNVTIAAATITYAEVAIYAGNFRFVGGGFMAPVKRVGFTDVSGIVNSTGIKNITVTTSGIQPGDFIEVMIANQATTPMTVRSIGFADASNHFQQATLGNTIVGARPSLVSSGPYISGVPTQQIWMAWQAS